MPVAERVEELIEGIGIPVALVLVVAAFFFMYKTYLDITYTRLQIHKLQREEGDETGKIDLPVLRTLV